MNDTKITLAPCAPFYKKNKDFKERKKNTTQLKAEKKIK